MKNNIFPAKLNAFLHDPVDKPFILMQGESHEQRAKKLAKILGVEIDHVVSQGADYIASAAERVFLPRYAGKNKQLQVKFLQSAEIIHPLSGNKLEFSHYTIPEINELKKIVEETMNFISNQIPGKIKSDSQVLYLYLWRNLLPLLQQNSPPELKKLWSVAPADTRVPDHSIFEHLKVTSACFGSFYNKTTRLLECRCAFLLFTIGPVQSFISQARKTQDLYWGSFLLSYLSWVAIKEVVQRYGPDAVIFPELHGHALVDHWLKTVKRIQIINDNSGEVQIPALPNRFLAIIPVDEINEAGKKTEEAVRQEFKTIATWILQKNKFHKHSFDRQFDRQIDNFLEIYWVGVPWFNNWQNLLDKLGPYFSAGKTAKIKKMLEWLEAHGEYPPNPGTTYSLLYTFTEKALGSRKNLREFKQFEEKGRKCSICGSRNVLFYRDNDNKYKGQDAAKIPLDFPLKYAQEGEGLCGICFTKRCAEDYFECYFHNLHPGVVFNDFPSTAEIALADFKERLIFSKKDDFKNYVTRLRKIFKEKIPRTSFLPHTVKKMGDRVFSIENIDAEWFIEDNLTPALIKKQLSLEKEVEPEKVDKVKELLCALCGKDKYTRYYAVLMLDGDNMGKWLGGEMAPCFEDIYHSNVWASLPENFKGNLQGKKRLMTPALHAAVSTALRNYSLLFVRKIVEEDHLGKLVYAGGDDVLAFVNLKDLLDVMIKLRAAFSGQIDKEFNVNFNLDPTGYVDFGNELVLTMGDQATASMGVCIAHYKTPLGEVLKQVKKMEKRAKNTENKNAFAIALLKHSGETKTVCLKWKYPWTGNEGMVGFLKKIVKALVSEDFSDKFAYNLRYEFDKFTEPKDLDELIKAEIKRLLARSCKIITKTEEDRIKKEQEIEDISTGLYNIFFEKNNFSILNNFLDIAVFLAREVNQCVVPEAAGHAVF